MKYSIRTDFALTWSVLKRGIVIFRYCKWVLELYAMGWIKHVEINYSKFRKMHKDTEWKDKMSFSKIGTIDGRHLPAKAYSIFLYK